LTDCSGSVSSHLALVTGGLVICKVTSKIVFVTQRNFN